MSDHPLNPDIDLVSGDFWGRNPHPEPEYRPANFVSGYERLPVKF